MKKMLIVALFAAIPETTYAATETKTAPTPTSAAAKAAKSGGEVPAQDPAVQTKAALLSPGKDKQSSEPAGTTDASQPEAPAVRPALSSSRIKQQ